RAIGFPGVARLCPEPAMSEALVIERRATITSADEQRLDHQRAATWHSPRGIIGWFSVADHKTIGRRYIVTAFCFFIFAGVLAGLMRLQVAVSPKPFIGPRFLH